MSQQKTTIHQKKFAIVWGDMDALGHVNNSRYFDYFQQARVEWLETIDMDMKQVQGPVIVHTSCTFLKPIVYPALLTLNSAVHSLGHSSFCIDHDLYQNDQLMAQGTCKIVWIDYKKTNQWPFQNLFVNYLTDKSVTAQVPYGEDYSNGQIFA